MNARISEIFYSLQGEGSHQGLPCIFIRHGHCGLRCHYCDSKYTWNKWKEIPLLDVLEKISTYPCRLVQITGGEPLEDPASLPLMNQLIEKGYDLLLETGGHCPIAKVPKEVTIILDIKTPASGEHEKNLWDNIPLLKIKDEIKFVICNEKDYLWSKNIIDEKLKNFKGTVLLSPANPGLSPKQLAEWMLRDSIRGKLQIQLHKLLWGNKRGV